METPAIPPARAFLSDFATFAGRGRLFAVATVMLGAAAVEGLGLALLVPLLAVLTGDGGGPLQAAATRDLAMVGVASDFGRLAVLVTLFAAAMTVRAAVLMVRDRMLNRLQVRYVAHERVKLLTALADADWQRVAGLRHARVSSALTNDIARIAVAAQVVLNIAVAAVMLTVQLGLTLIVSWRVGLLALAVLTAGAIISGWRLRIAQTHGERLGRDGLALAHTTAQLLGGLKQAAAENRQHGFVRDYATTNAGMVERQIGYHRRVTGFQFVVAVSVAMACAGVLLAGAWLEADRAALLATLVILFRMVGPATGLQRDAETLAVAIPAHTAVATLARELRADGAPPAAATGLVPSGPLALTHAGFLHDGGGGVRDVTLTIEPGEIVGVAGPSGAGKTTLIDLMAGLYRPQRGTVAVGGVALTGAAAAAWRGRIAYVGQEAFLTSDTIRHNLDRDGADEAAIWAALETAAVADTIRAMPAGLDTMLAERGGRLSGGERQRVAIARALLRRPALLILDEATNAIDIATEDRVMAALAALDPAPAVVVVAHRAETLRRCTRIVRVEGGVPTDCPAPDAAVSPPPT